MASEQSNVVSFLQWYFRWVCGWNKPASGMETDCEALANDPCEWLSDEVVEFPSLGPRIYLAGLLPLCTVAFLIKGAILDRAENEAHTYIGWVSLIVVVLGYIITPIMMMRRRICLDFEGFHILSGNRETFVPWNCLLPNRDWDEGLFQIRIAVRDNARDEITVSTNEVSRTVTDGAKPDGVRIAGNGEIELTWVFRLDPRLFIAVARQMAAMDITEPHHPVMESSDVEPVHQSSPDQLPSGVTILPNGTLQVPISAVTFPDACCGCGRDTDSTRSVDVLARHLWWIPARMSVELDMPICSDCWRRSWIRYLLAAVILEVFWAGTFSLLTSGSLLQSVQIYGLLLFLAIFPTYWILGFPTLLWRPVKVVHNITTKEFRFRFAEPGYRDRMIQAIHDQE